MQIILCSRRRSASGKRAITAANRRRLMKASPGQSVCWAFALSQSESPSGGTRPRHSGHFSRTRRDRCSRRCWPCPPARSHRTAPPPRDRPCSRRGQPGSSPRRSRRIQAQGSVKEKRIQNGKDTSGQFLWMDLLKKRAGKWAVVRSAGARVVSADSPKAQSQDPTIVETMKQFAQDTGDAMVAGDVDKLNQIYADDWATVDSSGKIFTKESLLSDFKSGKHKLLSFEIGPMDVQVFGDVAVVQASVTEKRLHDGKDISGQFAFMDLLKKRE